MARKKGSTDYPVDMKREAIRLFFEEGWTKAEITAHPAIRDPERVGNWLWRYRKEGKAMFFYEVFRASSQGREPGSLHCPARDGK